MSKLPTSVRRGLAELLRAFDYSQAVQRDVWDFAVEIATLQTLGMTEADFRWLICSDYARHAREITRVDENGRQFRTLGDLSFSKRTCFVLTDRGTSVARSVLKVSAGRSGSDGPDPTDPLPPSLSGLESFPSGQLRSMALGKKIKPEHQSVPSWDKERRELRVSGTLVKRFKWPAMNQELILSAFEEEGWPPRIDDPLPQQPEQDPKRRLHDTIKCLNRKQEHPLLHFRGDGSGEGVLWDFIEPDDPLVEE